MNFTAEWHFVRKVGSIGRRVWLVLKRCNPDADRDLKLASMILMALEGPTRVTRGPSPCFGHTGSPQIVRLLSEALLGSTWALRNSVCQICLISSRAGGNHRPGMAFGPAARSGRGLTVEDGPH